MQQLMPADLLTLSAGTSIAKDVFKELIIFSKRKESQAWQGHEWRIANTPQQGINWIGDPPGIKAVIVRAWTGAYPDDGWCDEHRTEYRYSLKSRKGVINYDEKANKVLIEQNQSDYPVILFSESDANWRYEGLFDVMRVTDRYVDLSMRAPSRISVEQKLDEEFYTEGAKKYLRHLATERSRAVVRAAKSSADDQCQICEMRFSERYGYPYVEAHHKVPVSKVSGSYEVKVSDLALLCPNCHRALHILMRQSDRTYDELRSELRAQLGLE